MVIDKRKQRLIKWLTEVFSTTKFSCEPASSDASFRRYFRVQLDGQSFVVMDAPPSHEDCTSFLDIASILSNNGINAPVIFHQSLEKGFLVLSDFGSTSFLDHLSDLTADQLYDDAVQALHAMHEISLKDISIPRYDLNLLLREMELFEDWFVNQLLGVGLSDEDKNALHVVKEQLAQSALEQPQVFVHRDYHSRNLMLTQHDNPGIIDFQDAVVGPMTYDLVSLYRDCYIAWPDAKVYAWLDQFCQQRQQRGCLDSFDKAQFHQWFDWMGVQRHLKAIGIFSRLLLRDSKEGYLKDIPRTLAYITAVCARYEKLQPLVKLIEKHQLLAKFEALQSEQASS